LKIIVNALIGSAALHILYLAAVLAAGYVKTVTHKPSMAEAWGEVDVLQNEIAFGTAASPFLFLGTFLGLSVVCGLILYAYQKLSGTGN